LNIGREHFKEMAEHACRGGRLEGSFVPLNSEDVEKIFEACL
jgi:hypothetical protein